MNKKDQIEEDFLEKLLGKIKLSSDIRNVTESSVQNIAELLYFKFDIDFSHLSFEDTFEDLYSEINDAAEIAKLEIGSKTLDKDSIKLKLQENLELKMYISNVVESRKLHLKISQDYDISEIDSEFIEDIANLIISIIKIRARNDVIPLISRGLYSEGIKSALEFWNKNKSDANSKEGIWQKELSTRIEILQRILGGKVELLQEQAHVGSDNLIGSGDKIADYLFHHIDTKDVSFVEIKKPHTPLLGNEYRGTYSLSHELSGSISQVLQQRNELAKNFYAKLAKSDSKFDFVAPKCVIVVGSIEAELGSDAKKHQAFELQRQAVAYAVAIITFDELYDQFRKFNLAESYKTS